MTSSSLVLLPLHVFICSDLSHCLSFLPSPPLPVFMFIQTHLSLFRSVSPPFFFPSRRTRVSSFCYQPRFHNNCDLSVSA